MLAHSIMYAEARLPIPNVSTGGNGTTFNLLPVWINVLEAKDGSSVKPLTASYAAKRGAVIFVADSCRSSSYEIEDRGSRGSLTSRS